MKLSGDKSKSYIFLHIAVLLAGFTAIIGEEISLTELPLVWYRMGITSLSLLIVPGVFLSLKTMRKKDAWRIAGIGIVVALHWVCFYGSVKAANVTVALSTFATTSAFTAFLEPLLLKQKFKWHELGLSVIVIIGMFLIFTFGLEFWLGIVIGLAGAFLSSLFSVLNKKYVDEYEPVAMSMLQIGAGFLFLTVVLPLWMIRVPDLAIVPSWSDLAYILILAVLCTSLAFVLWLKALKHLSTFTSNLSYNLEPIYGIIMAFIFYREYDEIDARFFIGAGLILAAVFLHPLITRRLRKLSESQQIGYNYE